MISRDVNGEVGNAERSYADAVAIVGVGFRLPGGISSMDELWSALTQGRDLVTEVPEDRFPVTEFKDPNRERPGKTYTVAGGFLEDIAGFDASYFGVLPRGVTYGPAATAPPGVRD